MSKKRLINVLLIGVATLILLYLGYRLLDIQANKPLQNELGQLTGVKGVEIVESSQNKIPVVQVTPMPTMNLAYLYHQVDELVKSRLKNYQLVIVNQENEEAELLFDQLSLNFYGGLDRKEYENMLQRMKTAAAQQGWDIGIQMDETNVFVVMESDGKIWYRVIKRYPNPLKEEPN